MPKFVKKSSRKLGLPPGTLIHIGEKKIDKTRITMLAYDSDRLLETEVSSIEDVFALAAKPAITWLNIDGIHEVAIIEKVGKYFDIHPLTLEDIVHTGQRPKFEEYDDYLYTVFQMLHYDKQQNEVKSEQVSLIVGQNYLISFQEREGDVLNPVRERIRKANGRIRKLGCDYLAYALIDAVVDHYFVILEAFGQKIEVLEDEVVSDPSSKTVQILHDIKREMTYLRKQIWPMREVINGFSRTESPLIHESTEVFFRDIHDHTIQLIDTIESFRDILTGMLDLYLSIISNRMNEVMKVLTIIATMFIPLTFVAGIYGMNFRYMPPNWMIQ
jgi:magnesium transporter